MNRFIYVSCILVLILAAFSVKAQVKTLLPLKRVPVNTLNYEQGLLNNETAAIITDKLGFTWVSTVTGLQRYNGCTLENIDPLVGRDTVKIRSRVYFYRLKSGNLWISCKKGVLEYNPVTNVFKNIIPVKSNSDEVFAIIPLSETAEGVWCLKEGAGMVIYNKEGRLKKTVPSVNTGILDAIIRADYIESSSCIVNSEDHIFIRTVNNVILDYNTSDYRCDEISMHGQLVTGISCNASFFYVGTPHNISKFRISDRKLINIYSFRNITDQPIAACAVYCIGNNRLLVNVNNQVIEFDADFKTPRLLTTFSGQPLLLAGNVEHIYYDEFERIWLLTNDDIKRIQDREIPFSYLKYPGTGNFVRCLYFDEQKQELLAGCINGGLQVYDKLSNPLWHAPLQTNEVKDVLAIQKLSTNDYLIITWTKGWYLLDLQNRKFSAIKCAIGEKTRKLLTAYAFSSNIQQLNDSTLLVATISNVFRCVLQGNILKSAKPLLPFFKTIDDRISCAHYASDGTLWVGDNQGLVFRMEKSGAIEMVALPEKFNIRCFTEDVNHHIWIGTSSGLYSCTLQGRLLKSFYKSSGLLNDCIYSLQPLPGKSAVMAGSNMGLSAIALNGNIRNYTKEMGLQDNEFNTAAAITTRSGKFYFGGVNGITAFFPSALKELQNKPILNVTKLVVNDLIYNSSGIWKGDTIRLKYNQNHLQFDFAAMGPLNADKYFYRYRLIGFEKHWQNTNQPTDIRYILQPGKYTLEVACSNELSGPEVKKNILIVIDPPFWLTWWFFVTICLCAIGGLLLLLALYNKRRYQKTFQELILKQRLQSQRERISRDLHDNLGAQANAIFYGTELLKQNIDHGQTLVENLHDTAGDMLTMLRETLWALKVTQVDAADLWMRILNFARKMGAYSPNVKMSISGSPPGNITLNASMALNMILIVQEAINNAIRHSYAAVISINSYSDDNSWRIEIKDDGKGFDLSAISKKTESYGLENMAQRANESNITFVINSLPSQGTKVFLEVNLNKIESQLI